MERSLKQEFTRRLSQCNKGELIIITYDILFAYLEEAKSAYEQKDNDAYKTAIRKAQASIDTLNQSLNYQYELSRNLHQLYVYTKNTLAKAIYQNRLDGIEEVEKILKSLYASFLEAVKTDTSGPLMSNTQQVYAGMTYGKTRLSENFIDDDHRGFFV
ncbi:MAG: flagellar protein FliS [Agathobacter sp.]|nr:flagellar protein FliS [Agathobacter sp.]MBQ6811625.1 flagellar protein FliS [Agathobacter sp.]